MRRHNQNVERIVTVSRQLGELLQKVVFAGGSATGLLITDPAFPDVRPTIDLDVIVEQKSQKTGSYKVLSDNYLKIDLEADNLTPGDRLRARVISLTEGKLRGELID